MALLSDLRLRLRRLEIAYFGGSTTADRSVAEHELIVAALPAGDLEAAGRQVELNWRASLKRANDRLQDSRAFANERGSAAPD